MSLNKIIVLVVFCLAGGSMAVLIAKSVGMILIPFLGIEIAMLGAIFTAVAITALVGVGIQMIAHLPEK